MIICEVVNDFLLKIAAAGKQKILPFSIIQDHHTFKSFPIRGKSIMNE